MYNGTLYDSDNKYSCMHQYYMGHWVTEEYNNNSNNMYYYCSYLIDEEITIRGMK